MSCENYKHEHIVNMFYFRDISKMNFNQESIEIEHKKIIKEREIDDVIINNHIIKQAMVNESYVEYDSVIIHDSERAKLENEFMIRNNNYVSSKKKIHDVSLAEFLTKTQNDDFFEEKSIKEYTKNEMLKKIINYVKENKK
jgi:hypothetical protein